MNTTYEKIKADQIRSMFFILRILTLFLCAFPVFQNIYFTIHTATIALIILSIVVIFWFVINGKKAKSRVASVIEMIAFYLFCAIAVYMSGSYRSDYKFLFIFLVIAHTIENDMRTGFFFAGASSAYILALDLLYGNNQPVNHYFETDLALSAMFFVVAWTLGYYVRLERNHIRTLMSYVNRDGLTDLYNHRYFHEYLKDFFSRENISEKPVSLIMMDLDGFKAYNDIFGHQQGDQVLRTISRLLVENVESGHVVCRYGGEEFALILPYVFKEQAVTIASNLKNIIDAYPFTGQDHLPKGNLTISAGVSQSLGKMDSHTALIERTDSALYRAKFLCSNRVEIYASVFDEFTQTHGEDTDLFNALQSVKTLITVINSRDRYTYNHVERVVLYCEKVANHLNMDYETKKKLICAAYLHDLGKINLSKELLISDEPLTDEQWNELKQHSRYSAEIIAPIPELRDIVPIVRAHHERYDGGGYPDRLTGTEIPYLARVLTLVDSFDAMTHRRPYKPIKSHDEAFEEIRRCSGTQFDPDLTEHFIAAMESDE